MAMRICVVLREVIEYRQQRTFFVHFFQAKSETSAKSEASLLQKPLEGQREELLARAVLRGQSSKGLAIEPH